MKKLAVICVVAVVWLVSGQMVLASGAGAPVSPPAVPLAGIAVSCDKIELGTWPQPGRLSAAFKALIVANCPHRVEAAFGQFRQEGGKGTIPPEYTYVTINGMDVPVAGRSVAIITSSTATPVDGLQVPLELQVSLARVGPVYRAGMYKGVLSLTVKTDV